MFYPRYKIDNVQQESFAKSVLATIIAIHFATTTTLLDAADIESLQSIIPTGCTAGS